MEVLLPSAPFVIPPVWPLYPFQTNLSVLLQVWLKGAFAQASVHSEELANR